jgi:hypothetical protein
MFLRRQLCADLDRRVAERRAETSASQPRRTVAKWRRRPEPARAAA